MKQRPQLSVILPTYNERGNIVALIKSILKITAQTNIRTEILVIDDNSPDQTALAVKKTFNKNANVSVIIRIITVGLASAVFTGIQRARGEFILIMDTDFNHDPAEIPEFWRNRSQKTMVIGSRYIPGGGMENKKRELLSNLFNQYLQILLGHNVHDNLSGFFLISRHMVRSLPAAEIFYGFGDYFIRLIYFAHKRNFTFKEIPVFYKNRTYGVSKSRFVHMFISYTYSAIKLKLSGF